jgi:hypothetical protein
MTIKDIILAPKPCLVTGSALRELVQANLAQLATHPLDLFGPGLFDRGLKNLSELTQCNFTLQSDGTYLIENKS